MIAADQRVNGHQYQLVRLDSTDAMPKCAWPCDWVGTPWPFTSPDHWDLIHRAAAEWHKHAATAAPITREQAAS